MAKMTDIDVRLIPDFDGENQRVEEWLQKAELICELRKVTELHTVLPMRLSGGAFAVYQQLGEKEKKEYKAIKKALLDAFAVDRFQAYNEFISRKLRPGESVDVYSGGAPLRHFRPYRAIRSAEAFLFSSNGQQGVPKKV